MHRIGRRLAPGRPHVRDGTRSRARRVSAIAEWGTWRRSVPRPSLRRPCLGRRYVPLVGNLRSGEGVAGGAAPPPGAQAQWNPFGLLPETKAPAGPNGWRACARAGQGGDRVPTTWVRGLSSGPRIRRSGLDQVLDGRREAGAEGHRGPVGLEVVDVEVPEPRRSGCLPEHPADTRVRSDVRARKDPPGRGRGRSGPARCRSTPRRSHQRRVPAVLTAPRRCATARPFPGTARSPRARRAGRS